jgi:hypothetical protein
MQTRVAVEKLLPTKSGRDRRTHKLFASEQFSASAITYRVYQPALEEETSPD